MNTNIHKLDPGGVFPYKKIFNPAITKYGNGYLLVCRLQNHAREGALGLARLDDAFRVVGEAHVIADAPSGNSHVMLEDPRIVNINGEIFIAYIESSPIHLFTTYVVLAKLSGAELVKPIIIPFEKNHDAFVRLRKYDLHIEPEPSDAPTYLPSREWIIEKNWQFFSLAGKAYCIYSANHTHDVFEFDLKNGAVQKRFTTYFDSGWSAGDISGGATPVLHPDGRFYSFFHSWTADAEKRRTYHAGVYVFEAKPPFAVKAISLSPLVTAPATPKGHAVIFPGSAIFDDATNEWVIAAGQHDEDCVLLRIQHETILSSLVDVKQVSKWRRVIGLQLARVGKGIKKRLRLTH